MDYKSLFLSKKYSPVLINFTSIQMSKCFKHRVGHSIPVSLKVSLTMTINVN